MKEIVGLIILTPVMVFLFMLLVKVSEIEAEKEKEWIEFSKANNCKIVERKESTSTSGSGVGIGINGGVAVVGTSSYTPEQVAWLCDDGIKYWRNK